MKKTISTLILLISLLAFQSIYAITGSYQVKPSDIYKGYIVEKIWLSTYATPKVTLSDIIYASDVILPKDARLSDPQKFEVAIGMDRKKPFAIIRIPAFVAGADAGKVNQVSSFTLSIEEPQAKNIPAAKTTDVGTSVLATGTWYKIGITKTGFYKIDYNFIKSSLGINPSTVNPSRIRVFGNGGHMLSEANFVPRPSDLIENAILINGNGDNVFDNGESAVFYGVGPTEWDKDSVNSRFVHIKNLYTDTAYYFINFGDADGLRVSRQTPLPSGNVTVNSFNYYDVHDSDMVNPPTLGKNWYGEKFIPALGNLSQTFSFDMGSTPISAVFCNVSFACTSQTPFCTFSVTLNGSNIGTSTFVTATPAAGDDVMTLNTQGWPGTPTSQFINVGITFALAQNDATGVGYLNYIELNTRRYLSMTSDQMNFRDWASVSPGNVANYQLTGANGSTSVWDVTNPQIPVIMNGSLNGNTYAFTQDASMLHEFAAMNSLNLYTPSYVGTVPNQNLHGSGQVDLIIVTYPGFLSQAQQVADYHTNHDHLRVIVATTTQVYNEFSSGGQDISAIRDFARMFYKRAGNDNSQMPKYMLLFGGASYDYKDRLPNNSNYVPVFESAESLNDLSGFSTDDFYGFLDDSEYIEDDNLMNILDIGVGRLPARNTDDATALVNKIINYKNTATLGPWRISTTIVADKGCNDPAGDHMADAEGMAVAVTNAGANLYNQEKVYTDAIPIISTPAGPRCPNANATINEQVFKGTSLINYNGHGNPTVWSTERILTEDDFNNWNNPDMLPFMVTATCDFGQFDHPQYVSSAEKLVLRPGGGVIVILTTTQAVYAYYNHELNVQFLTAQFTANPDGAWNTFGEASRRGKNETYGKALPHDGGEIANFRKFSLLGDPAIVPDFPQYNIHFDSVMDGVTMQHSDTVRALGSYTLYGSVRDGNGNLLSDFNGLVSLSFYDKPKNVTTISGCNSTFQVQNSLVYKGRVSVTNGLYTLKFITPKDINYYFGTGKISTYADNGATDAAGSDTSITVGGYSDHPQTNTIPPVVKPYINDSLFLNGGITSSNTSLYVSLYSETGINVSGNDVGHDLTGVLDGNVEAPYILNDYYETAPNTYQRGYITFPLSGLADGKHSITVRAWDVNNNLGEGTVDFIVIDGKVVDIQQLMNYPNPFTNTTHFVFEHNHYDEQLDVQIEIYSISGSLVKTIKENITPSGSRTNEIIWDGTDNNGARLPSGVYVYRLNIATDKGFRSSAYQKLVIIR
jgi:hypothetical protein